MQNKDKMKNDININVRIDKELMRRINKCCAKKWNINVSVFAREALKKLCEITEQE